MGPWLLIIVPAMTVILWQVTGAAGAMWREQAHVMSQCKLMETAALNNATLCERFPDGSAMFIMPGSGPADQDFGS